MSTTVWLLKGRNLGELVLFMCAPFILCLLAIPWLDRLGRRQVDEVRSLLEGRGLLAHWTYELVEWRRYAVAELVVTARRSVLLLAILYAAFVAFSLFLSAVIRGSVGQSDVEAGLVLSTWIAVPPVVGLVVASLTRYLYNVWHPGEVYIGATGVYMSERWYGWGARGTKLRQIRRTDHPQQQFHFVIEVPRLASWYTLRVPIPKGREQESALVSRLLAAGAPPEGVARLGMVSHLRALGFFDFVDPAKLEDVLEGAQSSGDLFVPEVKRTVEFGSGLTAEEALTALEQFGQMLQRDGVPQSDLRGNLYPNGVLTVEHQGSEWLLLMPFELEEDGGWQVVTARMAAVANLLLAGCGAEHRAHALFGEDRGLVAILTPEISHTLWPELEDGGNQALEAEAPPEEVARLLIPASHLTREELGALGGRLLAQGLQIATASLGDEDADAAYTAVRVTGVVGRGLVEAILQVPLPDETLLLIADAQSPGLQRLVTVRQVQ